MKIDAYNNNMPVPEGFRIVTVGTGAPNYDPERASACTLIQYQDTSILVDLGHGSVSRMLNAGLDAFQISNVMFSHCKHFDHTLDYGYFMCLSWLSDLPLNIYGPQGTFDLHHMFYDTFEAQLNVFPRQRAKEFNCRELADGDLFSIGEIQTEVKEVPHIVQNFAYRFSAGGKSVVVTGDMSYSEEFIPFAADADVIVFDANTAPSELMTRIMGQQMPAGKEHDKMRRPGGNAHAELEQIADMAQRANAKAIVLTHFTMGPEIETIKRRISDIYHGVVIIAEDMLTIEL